LIFKILSLADFEGNIVYNRHKNFQLTLEALLHYLVKFETLGSRTPWTLCGYLQMSSKSVQSI